MEKIDLKREMKSFYSPSDKIVSQVTLPTLRYLMIDGEGDPNDSRSYSDAVEALFSVAYAIKFRVKKSEIGVDYGVMPLEGLWWAEDMTEFSVSNKSNWKWTMMILQPDFATADLIEIVRVETMRKKSLEAGGRMRLETLSEGVCAQIMHIGPFSEEGPTVQKVHDYIQANGELTGKHHEIYLSDVRKAAPSKWKTVIRQPMIVSANHDCR